MIFKSKRAVYILGAARQSRAVNDAVKWMINKAQPQPPCRPLLVLSHRPFESHSHSPRALRLHQPNLNTLPLSPINTLHKQCLDAAKAERYLPILLAKVKQ